MFDNETSIIPISAKYHSEYIAIVPKMRYTIITSEVKLCIEQ